MPRRAKGPRLWFDRTLGFYYIRDGATKRGTGCGPNEREQAERKLQAYIGAKYSPSGESRPDRLSVAEVIAYYGNEIAPNHKASATTGYAIDRLLEWWGDKSVADIKRSTCNAYVRHRMAQTIPQAKSKAARQRKVSQETARRELSVLRAALRSYHAEYTLSALPIVTLPQAAEARTRWLTRGEAAALLRGARTVTPKAARAALCRMILIGIYTGTRSGAIRRLGWMPNTIGGWADVQAGVLYRKSEGERSSRKQQTPVRLPGRLLAHMRRWRRLDADKPFIVSYRGEPVGKQRRSWATARGRAGLGEDVTPHTLRHTAATWLMQAGVDIWDAAHFLGMSPRVLEEVYGHHHPDFQKEAAEGIGRRRL
jgi:integrase